MRQGLNEGLEAIRGLIEGDEFPPGTIRKWASGEFEKQADGTWKPVTAAAPVVKPKSKVKAKTISAKFKGTCPDCKKSIAVGDPLSVVPGDKKWRCPDCTDKVIAAMAPEPEPTPAAAVEPAPKKPKKPKAPDVPAPTDKIETTVCGRCGGSGKYSYNQIDGDRCYGCGGTGMAMTKRGKLANEYLRTLRSVPASTLKVGDLVQIHDFFRGMYYFAPIIDLKINPPDQYHKEPTINYTTEHPKYGKSGLNGAGLNSQVRKGWTKAEKAEQFKKAMEFQASLTINGKPKKS